MKEDKHPAAAAGTLQLGELTVRRMGFGAMRVTTDGSDIWGPPAEARRAGKIRHLGLSNVSLKQLETARRITPIVSVQNEYNLENRKSEDVLEACERLGVAFIPWYPLGDGAALNSRRVKQVAKGLGAPPAQVALAWLLAHSPVMLPIPGTASIAHLEENTAAATLKLSPAELAAVH